MVGTPEILSLDSILRPKIVFLNMGLKVTVYFLFFIDSQYLVVKTLFAKFFEFIEVDKLRKLE